MGCCGDNGGSPVGACGGVVGGTAVGGEQVSAGCEAAAAAGDPECVSCEGSAVLPESASVSHKLSAVEF